MEKIVIRSKQLIKQTVFEALKRFSGDQVNLKSEASIDIISELLADSLIAEKDRIVDTIVTESKVLNK